MALDTLVRSAVALAGRVVDPLRVAVSHAAWASTNAYGEHTYATAVSREALVDWKQRLVQTRDGKEALSVCTVTFFEDVALDIRDKLTLPGGQTAPLLAFEGLVDPSTNRRYLTQAFLGGGA